MKEVKKLSAFVLAALLLFIIMPVHAEAPDLTIYRITDSGSNNYAEKASVHQGKIVWADARNGNYDIYMYDTSKSEELQITTNEASQTMPKIFGDLIVWQDSRNGETDIYLYNLSTQEETQITSELTAEAYPDIYEDKIVWQDSRSVTNYDIYMYDISEAVETRITVDATHQMYPAIYGDKIVWEDARNLNSDIYLYDISESTESRVTTDGSPQGRPDIFENVIVWEDGRNGFNDVYLYNLTTLSERQITTDENSQSRPKISGNIIIWQDERIENDATYMYDLNTSTEIRITADDHLYPEFADISENIIVWDSYDDTYDYSNIYYADLSFPDSTPPTFSTLPGDTRVVNLTEGELITTNPYIINVNPDDDTAIERVEFYVDGILICTDTEADTDGVYSCAWDTSKYHSDIRIVAYDTDGNNSEITRTVNVDPSLYTLPRTGMNIFDYVKYVINLVFGR